MSTLTHHSIIPTRKAKVKAVGRDIQMNTRTGRSLFDFMPQKNSRVSNLAGLISDGDTTMDLLHFFSWCESITTQTHDTYANIQQWLDLRWRFHDGLTALLDDLKTSRNTRTETQKRAPTHSIGLTSDDIERSSCHRCVMPAFSHHEFIRLSLSLSLSVRICACVRACVRVCILYTSKECPLQLL